MPALRKLGLKKGARRLDKEGHEMERNEGRRIRTAKLFDERTGKNEFAGCNVRDLRTKNSALAIYAMHVSAYIALPNRERTKTKEYLTVVSHLPLFLCPPPTPSLSLSLR